MRFLFTSGVLVFLAACAGAAPAALPAAGNGDGNGAPRDFVLTARRRVEEPAGSGRFKPVEEKLAWPAKKTAVIICDMWDTHNCKSAARRVTEMVPRLNAFVRAARAAGAFIIHCPSDTADKFYAEYPQRKLAKAAPAAQPPVEIKARRYDPAREGPFPFDNSVWNCDDDPPCPVQKPYPWTRQHADIEIADGDAITESGQEVYNLCVQRGVTNILMTGVHTNHCIVGRSFGIRQLVMLGRPVVLVRDLTDSLYNPRNPPHVSHERGTELVVEHIEKYWCPSVLSRDVIGR
jgi:nicotinamidase-related amidase